MSFYAHGTGLLRCILVWGVLLSCVVPAADARIILERAQREAQARYSFIVGEHIKWPDCDCNGVPPPAYPTDRYYGEVIENNWVAAEYVSHLIQTIHDNAGVFANFVEPNPASWPDESIAYIPLPNPNPPNITRVNYDLHFVTYLKFLRRLNHYAVPVETTGNFTFPDPDKNAVKHISFSTGAERSCGELQQLLDSDYASRAWTPSDDHLKSFVRLRSNDSSGGSARWGYTVVKGTLLSDLTPFTSAPMDAAVYAFLHVSGGGFGSAPAGMSLTTGWQPVQSGAPPVADSYYLSGVIPDVASGDPPPFDAIACQTSDPLIAKGWVISNAVTVITPQFNTRPRIDISCETLCCPVARNGLPKRGRVEAVHGSVAVRIGLGGERYGRQAGYLLLESDGPSPTLSSPASLFHTVHRDVILHPPQGTLEQIRTCEGLVILDVIDAYEYTLSFFQEDEVIGSVAPFGTHSNAVPFSAITLRNPDGASATNRLQVVEEFMGRVLEHEYQWDAAAGDWILLSGTGSGQRKEFRTVSWTIPGSEWEETTEIRDALDTTGLKITETFHVYPWGAEQTEEIVDPDGRMLLTTWEFYDDAPGDGPNYANLKSITEPGGRWRRFEYDAMGRIFKVISQWLDEPAGASESLSRVLEFENDTTNGISTVTESIRGLVVAKEITRYAVDLFGRRDEEVIQCLDPASSFTNSPGALRTRTIYTPDTHLIAPGRPERILHSDGTVSLFTYAATGSDGLRTTRDTGSPQGDPLTTTVIEEGTRTEIWVDPGGTTTLRESYDLSGAAVGPRLSLSQVIAQDALGRPEQITGLSGIVEEMGYDCCGVTSRTNRDGSVETMQRDEFGRLTNRWYAGVSEENAYDVMGRVTNVVRRGSDNSELLLQSSVYDIAGDLTESRNAAGEVTTVSEVFANGRRVTTTVNPDGGTSIEELYGDGSLYQVTGTAVHPFRHYYDAVVLTRTNSGIVESLNTRSTRTILLHDDGGMPTETTEWSIEYLDMLNRPVRTAYPDGSFEDNFYNEKGQLIKNVNPDGHVVLLAYDQEGKLRESVVDMDRDDVIDYAGTDRVERVTSSILFDPSRGMDVHRSVSERFTRHGDDVSTHPDQQVDVSLDGLERWVTVQGSTTHERTEYPGAGIRKLTVAVSDGSFSVNTYLNGRMVSFAETNSVGEQLRRIDYGYDAHGRVAVATDARNGSTTYTYDAADRVETLEHPAPAPGIPAQVITNVYDAAGRLQFVSRPTGVVTNEYHLTGRVKKTSGSDLFPIAYTYDYAGRIASMKTWRNEMANGGEAITEWIYDPMRGWLVEKRDAAGQGEARTYRPDGKLSRRTLAGGQYIDYAYNGAGEPVEINFSGSTPDITFTYDRRGNPTNIIDAAGALKMQYDAHGRLIHEEYQSGPLAGLSIGRNYDPTPGLNRPVSVAVMGAGSAPVHAVSYTFDSASRLETVQGSGHQATYGYFTNSMKLRETVFHDGITNRLRQVREYDFNHRLTNIAAIADGNVVDAYCYRYNEQNQRERTDLSDGTYWITTHDRYNQVASADRYWPNGVPVAGQDFAYEHDSIGNRISVTHNGRAQSLRMNDLNQVTNRTVPGAVDISGHADPAATVTVNNLSVERTNDHFHIQLNADNSSGAIYDQAQIVAVLNDAGPQGEDLVAEENYTYYVPPATEPFFYDPDGNLLSDGRWDYTWSGDNRLIRITSNNTSTPPMRIDFAYDYVGRRFRKTVWDNPSGAGDPRSDTLYVYDGWNLIAEIDTNHTVIARYTWGLDVSDTMQGAGGIGGLLFAEYQVPTGAVNVITYDGNGNISKVLDATTIETNAHYEYTPFGGVVRATGPLANQHRFRFSTKYEDPETGFHYFGFRSYSPFLGRWLSRDPIHELGGLNLYAYVNNNPLTLIDRLGLAHYAFDGTNNKSDESFTHVWMLHLAYQKQKEYVFGVGARLGTKLVGGITGKGGRNRTEDMYQRFLKIYEAGDTHVDIIGFSRGAALAREFANILHERGYDPEYTGNYQADSILVSRSPKKIKCPVEIRFVGLFDTVGSFGVPGNQINVGIRMNLPPNVKHAAHAVAKHERRSGFPVTLLNSPVAGQTFNERVFRGDHSDIGGGHRDGYNLLSLRPLYFIANEGRKVGVPYGPMPVRPWSLQYNSTPHDLTEKIHFRDGGPRENLP